MSTALQKVAPLLVANGTSIEPPKRKRSKPYKARVATKIKWALADAMERAVAAQGIMERMLVWLDEEWGAIGVDDHARLVRLGRFEHLLTALALEVTKTERIVTTAMVESKVVDGRGTAP